MITIAKITKELRKIVIGPQQKNIVDLGLIQNIQVSENNVTFNISSHNPQSRLKQLCEEKLKTIPGIGTITCSIVNKSTSQPASKQPQTSYPTLANVKHIVAISSCKGGVGKSTVSALLARDLVAQGYKVGLLDLDLQGPSLPTLFNLKNTEAQLNEFKNFIPVEQNNLKLMSFGFLLGENPAIMRGPILTRYVQQVLLNTAWGELDYLLLDLPPGTGDIHLTITQTLKLTGTVIVTTPHVLALQDVMRGILMFEKVSVPILGVIENMAYYQPDHTDEKHFIFGQEAQETLTRKFAVTMLGQLPITEKLNTLNSTPNLDLIYPITQQLIQRIDQQQPTELPDISVNDQEIIFAWPQQNTWRIPHRDLRLISEDALSVDEITGRQIIDPKSIPIDIKATEIVPIGNYGIGVSWSDGHKAAIYPFKRIQELLIQN